MSYHFLVNYWRHGSAFFHRRFTVDWIWLRETSFDHIGHIPVKNNPGYLMKSCYDGTEISRASGLEALTIFSTRT